VCFKNYFLLIVVLSMFLCTLIDLQDSFHAISSRKLRARILLTEFEAVKLRKSLKQILGVATLFWPHSSPFVVSIGGRDSLVGILNRYVPDSQVFESRWGRNFSYPSRPALYSRYRISFTGVKRRVRVVKQPPSLAPRLMKELISHGPLWHVIGHTLPFRPPCTYRRRHYCHW
jgi:hypothetical protein